MNSGLAIKIKDAYVSINNMDLNLNQSVSRFDPTWSYIIVNKKLEVVVVEKYKKDFYDIEEEIMTLRLCTLRSDG